MTRANVQRGCGVRQPGGAYLVTALSHRGKPLEEFILDPPRPFDPIAHGMSAQGLAIARQAGGGMLVLDWVGARDYPNVADFLEEASLYGTSRRAPTNFAFDQLAPGTQHLFIHPRAGLLNPSWLHANRAVGMGLPPPKPSFLDRVMARQEATWCPFKGGDHECDPVLTVPVHEMCAALWWEALLPDTLTFKGDEDAMEAQCQRAMPVLRELPGLHYQGYTLPDADIWTPRWEPAAFLSLPITRVEVVRDPGDLTHEITLSRMGKVGVPVEVVDD